MTMLEGIRIRTARVSSQAASAALVVFALVLAPALALAPARALAETEGDLARAERTLQAAFEGTHVTVLIDMPATASGVDVTPEAPKPLDLPDYQSRLKKAGVAVKRGESIMVTKVKVKSKLIEFQLGGGGYGTFFDEKANGGGGGISGKSAREKNLERDLKTERDPGKRRAMNEELDRLRRDRRQDDREANAESRQAEALDKERIRDKALSGGSRFNIRYPDGVPSDALTPDAVMEDLAKYVEFEAAPVGRQAREMEDRGDREDGPGRPAHLRKGATLDEVEALYGPPVATNRRNDAGWAVVVNRYKRGSQSVEGTFIEGVLVRYTLSEE